MKQIAGLAANNEGKRKRKNDDDNFGMNDDDWHVYRDVANDSDSEGEEEENAALQSIEQELLQYDSTFTENDTAQGKADPAKSLLHAFYHGPYDPDKKHELAMDYQLHLNVERIRAPEIIFTPSLVGMDQCGIVEMTKDILTRVAPDQRSAVVRDFYTTGGNTLTKGFNERLKLNLQSILPAGEKMSLRGAKDPVLDSWRGAAKWAAKDAKYKTARVSRAEYQDMGSDYIKEHGLGNLNV
jgi:actin-related protein 5